MSSVFISFEKTDADMVVALAAGLERSGVRTWYYLRDSLPGPSYLRQIATAITDCQAVVVIASPASLKSDQVTSEIVQAFEQRKPIVPLRRGVTHEDVQKGNPEWRGAFRAATSVEVPADGFANLLPNLVKGLGMLGVTVPVTAPADQPTAIVTPSAPPLTQRPVVTPSAPLATAPRVELGARFDRTAYPPGDDALTYWLAEFQVDGAPAADRPGADLALVLDVSGSMDKPNRYPLLREAVRQLVCGLAPHDRVSVTLFSDRAREVVPFLSGEAAADDPDRILNAMDTADNKFGGKTFLAPALQLALAAFAREPRTAGRVRRTYVLTDGELHDTPECEAALGGFRPQSAEVHVYGFGEDFNAAALKRLVGDQIGGTVKPIVSEGDIGRVFAHVAAVNRRLIGQDGKLAVALAPGAVGGDAWVYQPQNRYLGPIQGGRVEHVFGGIESGRKYSLLLEVRLPPDGPVAALEASWTTGERPAAHRAEVTAPRGADGEPVADVGRALNILHVLRAVNDKDAQLASYRARRELAVLENRDPELIAALDKLIAGLTAPPATAARASGFRPLTALSEREELLIAADPSTHQSISLPSGMTLQQYMRNLIRDRDLLDKVNALLTAGRDPRAVVAAVARVLIKYVAAEGYDREQAVEVLASVCKQVGLSAADQVASKERFLDALDRGDPNAF